MLMARNSLDREMQTMLSQAISLANGDLEQVNAAVRQVLLTVRPERARWTYLRNELTRRMKVAIRRAERAALRKKEYQKGYSASRITPAMRLDAYRHEQELMKGIPESDR